MALTKFSSARILFLSFGAAILLGTAVLMFPACSTSRESIGLIDAAFTSTSAVCVTGLIVLDTGSDFSPLGEAVILILIQLGGLGIMTFSALILYWLGFRPGLELKDVVEETHGDILSIPPRKMIGRILLWTFLLESLGALLFFFRFRSEYSFTEAVWLSVFHSVSAFCNAGFSLFTDSFMGYRQDLYVNTILISLIIVGGLGFIVLMDTTRFFRMWRRKEQPRRLLLQTKVVLITTVILIAGGGLFVAGMEIIGGTAYASEAQTPLSSLFLSVTARTAGFNTTDTSLLGNGTLIIVMILMLIGASPGSTGGGLKTTTFAVIVATIRSNVTNQPSVRLLNRKVPSDLVAKAFSTLILFLLLILAGVTLLEIFNRPILPSAKIRGVFLEHLFETISACCTVGLSTGITPELSTAGKTVIILCMFIGRLGPLVVAGSLIGRMPGRSYELPEERVMVG
jgi:trk system potassium uptake protein